MRMHEYLFMLVKAYNPNQYERLMERSLFEHALFLAATFCVAVLMFIVAIIPATFELSGGLHDRLTDATAITFDADVESDGPIELLDRPHIVLDPVANTTPARTITLSDQGIHYREFLFFGTKTLRWSDVQDLKEPTVEGERFLLRMAIFLLPSVVFWFVVFTIIELAVLYLTMTALGYAIPRAFGYHVTYVESLKVGILAMPSVLIMDLGLYPFAPLFWWGMALTAIYFFIGIVMVSEPRTVKHEAHKHKQ